MKDQVNPSRDPRYRPSTSRRANCQSSERLRSGINEWIEPVTVPILTLRCVEPSRGARLPIAANFVGGKVKAALERTLALSPRHADAHAALAAFHAEVIDKVGSLIGNTTYGARKNTSLWHFREALRLNPESAIAMTAWSCSKARNECKRRACFTSRLAFCQPADAMERLGVEMAKLELHDRFFRFRCAPAGPRRRNP